MLYLRAFFALFIVGFLWSKPLYASSSEDEYQPKNDPQKHKRIHKTADEKKYVIKEINLYAALAAYKHDNFYRSKDKKDWDQTVGDQTVVRISPKTVVPLGRILKSLKEKSKNFKIINMEKNEVNKEVLIQRLSSIGLLWAKERIDKSIDALLSLDHNQKPPKTTKPTRPKQPSIRELRSQR